MLSNQVQPLKLIYRQPSQEHLEQPIAFTNKLHPKDIVMINLNTKSSLVHDFTINSICRSSVIIKLANLSIHEDFELIVIVKNSKNKELENNFLWLGCTQKHVRLKSKQSKLVKFKLGFMRNGLYEIGNISNDNVLKMNLFEATNSLTSFENLVENKIDHPMMTSNQSNHSLPTLVESTAISVYLKNSSTNRYEFFKILNSFIVSVSSSS